MVPVDTSVWIQLFRAGEPMLSRLLEEGLVVMHPFGLGESAMVAHTAFPTLDKRLAEVARTLGLSH